jgi:hypothetical protein
MPVITEKPGIVKYQDLLDGKTLIEQTDDATGIAPARRDRISRCFAWQEGRSASPPDPAR